MDQGQGTTPDGGPGRRLVRNRSLRSWLVLVLVLGSLSIVAVSAGVTPHGSTAGAASVCGSDGSGGCQVVLPCTPPATQNCPTADVNPVSDVVDGQYLFVKATNFDDTGSMRVAICSMLGNQADPACLTGEWETNNVVPVQVPIATDAASGNLTTISYPAFYNPDSDGDAPFPAQTILGKASPGFFCDNAANPCAIIVTTEAGQGTGVENGQRGPEVTAQNSAVIPLKFRPRSSGCPTTAPQIQTLSSYSLEQFLPPAVQASCSAADGVTALNTTLNVAQVVQNFAQGGSPVAFVDDVDDPAVLGQLLGTGYSLIPVAVSGTEVGFLGGQSVGPINFPLSSYNVTPNMLAGVITSEYGSPEGTVALVNGKQAVVGTDLLVPPLECALLVGCPKKNGKPNLTQVQKYNAFELLNPSSPGVVTPSTIGAFMSSVPDGSSFNATSYICSSPNTPFSVTTTQTVGGTPTPVTQQVTDANLATKTLVTAPTSSILWPPPNVSDPTWPITSCTGTSSLPALGGSTPQYVPSQSPENQAKQLRSWAYGGGSLPSPPSSNQQEIGFAVMDSSEADFLGINAASVQNAAGAFVTPDTATLEKAADDMTPCTTVSLTCPTGTYETDYGNRDAGAYPMPDVTYALVTSTPQPAATATAIKDLLTNLVNYSHTAQLPTGYASLPDDMYQTAMAAIPTAVHALAGTATSTTTTTTTTTMPTATVPGATNSSDYGGSSYNSAGTALPLTDTGSSDVGGGSSPSSGNAADKIPVVATTVPTGKLLVALDTAGRLLLPAAAILALASLVGGLLLLFGPGARRRREESS